MRKWILGLAVLVLTCGHALADGEGNTIMLKFAGVPSGTCSFIMMGLNSSNGDLYDCPSGAWVKTGTGGGGGAGTVTNTGGALTSNAVVIGAGGNDTKVSTGITTNGASELDLGVSGTSGVLGLNGSTSGKATITAPAIAGTTTNAIASSNVISVPAGAAATTSVQLAGTPGTGMYFSGTGTIVFSSSTADNMASNPSTGLLLPSANWVGWSANSTIGTGTSPDSTIARSAAKVFKFGAAGNSTGTVITAAYNTDTNCAAVGTAANPSVASCTAASAGSFSCATNASTGTCTVNTTAVTANSEIFIEGRNDTTTGTRLGVTCNTGITTALPEISAVVAATSFTINLGTFTTNPECFSYFITN